jgi:cytochrome P450
MRHSTRTVVTTRHLPVGPRGRLLSGHAAELARDPLRFLTACARTHGDFVPLRFGMRRACFLNHPSYIDSMLVANRENVIKGPVVRSARHLYGNGLFLSEAERWQRQRRSAQPAFHRAPVAAGSTAMVARTERMLEDWQDGQLRDVQDEMMRLTLAIVGDTLLGVDISLRASEFLAALAEALHALADRVRSFAYLLPDALPLPVNRRLRRAVRRLDAVIADVIAEGRRNGGTHAQLLASLLEAEQDGAGDGSAATRLRDHVMTFLIAGHESSAVALSWTWYLLSEHPEAESRFIGELRSVLNGRLPVARDIPQLRYTEMVVLESMRLYPPVPLLGREAVRDCNIGGFHVRRGTVLVASQWVMHRDPRYFENAEAFSPERWDKSLLDTLPRHAYFPFGGGPRICIAGSFAMTELILLLATIGQRFRLARSPEQSIVPLASSSLFCQGGMKMTLTRRC